MKQSQMFAKKTEAENKESQTAVKQRTEQRRKNSKKMNVPAEEKAALESKSKVTNA